jgi:hypothetical protein
MVEAALKKQVFNAFMEFWTLLHLQPLIHVFSLIIQNLVGTLTKQRLKTLSMIALEL